MLINVFMNTEKRIEEPKYWHYLYGKLINDTVFS